MKFLFSRKEENEVLLILLEVPFWYLVFFKFSYIQYFSVKKKENIFLNKPLKYKAFKISLQTKHPDFLQFISVHIYSQCSTF